MGCSVSCNSSLPSQSPYEVPGGCNEKKIPDSIDEIMGQEVERSHIMYLYAIFCLTRLIEQYKLLMFPHIHDDLITFCDDEENYSEVVSVVNETLNYNEIQIDNSSRLGSDYEQRAKDAVQELAYLYFLCSASSIEVAIVKTMVFKVDEEYQANKKTLGYDDTLKVFYEDTLKMLIADLDRKDIYTPSVFHNNRRFQEWMKFKDPTAWREMKNKNVTFLITSETGETMPVVESSPTKWSRKPATKSTQCYRQFSRQSSDSIGFYYSECSQSDINEDMVSIERTAEHGQCISES